MIINSAMNEGLAGLQNSQRRMHQAAEDIVKAGVPTDGGYQDAAGSLDATASNNGLAASDLPATATVGAATETEQTRLPKDIVESVIDLKKQELLFDASANIVKVANDTMGQLIDDLS